jgi:hypothetical protein
MPTFDEYVRDINALQVKGKVSVTTHEQFEDLVRYYGDALRQFIEKSKFSKLPLSLADFNSENQKPTVLLAGSQAVSAALGPKVDAKYRDRVGREYLATADTQHGNGDTEKKAKNRDDASERYVDAAISRFRAALCLYSAHKADKPDATDVKEILAVRDCAKALADAADELVEAAGLEDKADTAEVAAEWMTAALFYESAAKIMDTLDAAMKAAKIGLDPATQKTLDDVKSSADNGKTSADTEVAKLHK